MLETSGNESISMPHHNIMNGFVRCVCQTTDPSNNFYEHQTDKDAHKDRNDAVQNCLDGRSCCLSWPITHYLQNWIHLECLSQMNSIVVKEQEVISKDWKPQRPSSSGGWLKQNQALILFQLCIWIRFGSETFSTAKPKCYCWETAEDASRTWAVEIICFRFAV